MTKAEREAFLAEVHVGVLAVDEPGRGPLALPIWYLLDGPDVVISMTSDSLKARLLRAAGRATMTIQTEDPPYKYVSVEGRVRSVRPTTTPSHSPRATWGPSWASGTSSRTPTWARR